MDAETSSADDGENASFPPWQPTPLKRRVVVAVPGEDGSSAAMGLPALPASARIARSLGRSGRPNRRPISICTARSPAGQTSGRLRRTAGRFPPTSGQCPDPDELGDGFLIIGGQGGKVEFARQHQFGERAGIALFLTGKAAGAQGVFILRQQRIGGQAGPTTSSRRRQTEAAAATLTCWPTMVRSSVS